MSNGKSGERIRPVAQESSVEGHLEVTLPERSEILIMDDECALALAEDIRRITESR